MNEDVIRLGLVDEDEIILDEAALTLAGLDHSGMDVTWYQDLFEALAARLATVQGDGSDARGQAASLAQVFGNEFGFVGDEVTYDDPANADLMRVVDRRRGLPISLSILYVAAARRLGWTANILDVPGHVLVLVGGDAVPVVIDPFHSGTEVARDRLIAMITAPGAGGGEPENYVAAMPNRAILVRLLVNQASRADAAGDGRRALELYRRITTVAPSFAQGWWERARLELVDVDTESARASLSAMLEVTRESEVRQKVSRVLRQLAGR